MKKSIFILNLLLVSTSFLLTNCSSPSQKVEEAKEDVTEAESDLVKAQQEYATDIEAFRLQTAARTEANNKSIAEFNARTSNEKKELQAEYQKKIAELEQKNSDMKKRMDEYKADSKEQWDAFKAEFNRDMDELGIALKDLTVKNNK
ncbi:MAG: peptidase M23 [Saprospiraceae bacterium]|nr:peptidase M23 [Saprospiraceae bacterium]